MANAWLEIGKERSNLKLVELKENKTEAISAWCSLTHIESQLCNMLVVQREASYLAS